MQLNDLKEELMEALQPQTKSESRSFRFGNFDKDLDEEEERPYHQRDYPPRKRRPFADQIANTDFSKLVDHMKIDTLSMVPHSEYVVANLKQEVSRE